MLQVKSNNLELRGIANKTSGKGTVYYTVNTETEDGTPHSFYCPNADAFPQGLKKGDKIEIVFDVSYYKGQEKLVVSSVKKM